MLSAARTVDVLRAAGEPSRLRILALLAREELAVLEICKVLDQFPDGAWVFYRPSGSSEARFLADQVLATLDPSDPALIRDAERLEAVRAERRAAADQYFARNASTWDEIRSLHVAEDRVEGAILRAAGPGPFQRLVDLGTGSGRMLTLIGDRARSGVGLDLSQQMLNVARARVEAAGLDAVELRHGDIFATRLPAGGRLVIIDFAPHTLEMLREQHQHRRLGFSAAEMKRWLSAAGLRQVELETLPPARAEGLTVCVWTAQRSPA